MGLKQRWWWLGRRLGREPCSQNGRPRVCARSRALRVPGDSRSAAFSPSHVVIPSRGVFLTYLKK